MKLSWLDDLEDDLSQLRETLEAETGFLAERHPRPWAALANLKEAHRRMGEALSHLKEAKEAAK